MPGVHQLHDPTKLPANLPIPQDDGACDHLGRPPFDRLPADIELDCTDGSRRVLRELSTGPLLLFFYPRTGVPGQPPSKGFAGEEWDEIPGARGCTPQSCSFRDVFSEFVALGVQVFGVSTNTREHQLEFKQRMHVPFEFLSDDQLELVRAMRLPTFEFPVESGGPTTLIKRMAWFIEPDHAGVGRIVKVWYPVFPPSDNAKVVLEWLRARRSHAQAASAEPAPNSSVPATPSRVT